MMILSAPAKINCSLRILRRRDDGFHELATRMVPLKLADKIHIEPADSRPEGSIAFTCSEPGVPADDSNLVLKAVRAVSEHIGRPLPSLRIHLEKHIPHGAGLGGGSSDAAAVLTGLNALLESTISSASLHALAAEIGSDVPFFLHGCACDCTGRGEIVTPVAGFRPRWPLLLIKLPFGVPTPWAYQHWQNSHPVPGVSDAPQHHEGVALFNDLERPVFEKHFVLADLKSWLRQQPEVAAALLSGSGSTMFAVLQKKGSASLQQRIRERIGPEVWLCETGTA
ncbi:MAG: 4-(cytidine 5'-diphospho)-2-C-methyl-D-erythritol kinase [Verrucomicrobiales bacterium]|nr:4-(cytidine 5'-diphospho)-2-C-methyl-D-erythritol kinase [Verrucomicrobiales bacterium]